MSSTTGTAAGVINNTAGNEVFEVRLIPRAHPSQYQILVTVPAGQTGSWDAGTFDAANFYIDTVHHN